MNIIGEILHVLFHLFDGVPLAARILYWVVLSIIALSWISLPALLVKGHRHKKSMRRFSDRMQQDGVDSYEDEFLWVFVVPALNEEVTIADSVERLQATAASNAVFLVVDDGSDDRTGEILAGISDPRLEVMTRVEPEARTGKAAVLNAAWHHLREDVLRRPGFSDWDEDHVVMTIVDADGRLDAQAPHIVADHFMDPEVGGVQALVRIYNRRSWLTWGQDVEFSTFGRVYQQGRAGWGTANMGGNGQFNRLAGLTQLALEDAERDRDRRDSPAGGPWRDKLTEDQDLGVRMVQAGWRGEHTNETWVDQQGVNSLRRLYRQRTRWAQGNWQAFSLLPTALKEHLSVAARIDAVHYLLSPALQLITGVGFVTSVVLLVVDFLVGEPVTFGAWWVVVIFLGLSFGPGIWALWVRSTGWLAPVKALVLVIPYSVYAWLVFPVLLAALVRQIAGRNSWAKTARESLEPIDAEVEQARSA